MGEQLSNTSFTSNLTGWTYDLYEYDAGWAKAYAYHTDVGDTGINDYMIYQEIAITNTAGITTATMSADIKWEVDAGSGTWVKFRLKLKSPGGSWTTPLTSGTLTGTDSWEGWATNEDVKTALQDGGDGTWLVGFNVEMSRDSVVDDVIGWFDDVSLNIDSGISSYDDDATETITLGEATSSAFSGSSAATETITLSDAADFSVGADASFGYYFGGLTGKVYAEDSTYASDDGTAIDAYWESKETDFAEISIDSLDKFKTIYKVRLWYHDIHTNTTVKISVKADGGSTWTSAESTMGSNSGTDKSQDYYLIKTGHSFRFRIENDSTDDEFQWSALEVYYTLGGDYFQV